MSHEPNPQLLDRLDHVQLLLPEVDTTVREILQLLKDEVSEVRDNMREHD